MKKKVSGQITLETAIVMPVMMFIIAGLICVVLYCHDALVINAYVYGTANEHINEGFEALQTALEKTENSAPLFIIRPEIKAEQGLDCIHIEIQAKSPGRKNGIGQIVSKSYQPRQITIEQNMSSEIIYISQTILNQIERNGES